MKRGTDYIGVTVSFLCHDGRGKILLHKRTQNSRDEQGKWDNGGGALEFGEGFEEAVAREIKEEYCADVVESKFLCAYNNLRQQDGAPTHWVNIVYFVQIDPAQVRIGEPTKMEELGWFSPNALPEPQHPTLARWIVEARKAKMI